MKLGERSQLSQVVVTILLKRRDATQQLVLEGLIPGATAVSFKDQNRLSITSKLLSEITMALLTHLMLTNPLKISTLVLQEGQWGVLKQIISLQQRRKMFRDQVHCQVQVSLRTPNNHQDCTQPPEPTD